MTFEMSIPRRHYQDVGVEVIRNKIISKRHHRGRDVAGRSRRFDKWCRELEIHHLRYRGVKYVRHSDVLIVVYIRKFQVLNMEDVTVQLDVDPGTLGTYPTDSSWRNLKPLSQVSPGTRHSDTSSGSRTVDCDKTGESRDSDGTLPVGVFTDFTKTLE